MVFLNCIVTKSPSTFFRIFFCWICSLKAGVSCTRCRAPALLRSWQAAQELRLNRSLRGVELLEQHLAPVEQKGADEAQLHAARGRQRAGERRRELAGGEPSTLSRYFLVAVAGRASSQVPVADGAAAAVVARGVHLGVGSFALTCRCVRRALGHDERAEPGWPSPR